MVEQVRRMETHTLTGALCCAVHAALRRTEDNRLCAVVVHKGAPGECWARLFRGDPDGARCLEPPYALAESDDDVTLTLALPFWTEAGDVRMRVGEAGLELDVRGSLHLRRTFWRNECVSRKKRLGA